MKKTILVMLMAGGSFVAIGQSDSLRTLQNQTTMSQANNMNQSLTSFGEYNAYGAYTATPPTYIESYVREDYPAASGLRWQRQGDWWHTYHVNDDIPMHLYYNDAGQSFIVSLPVKQTLIPDAVVAKANETWGPAVYDIAQLRGLNGQPVYHVRIIENGQVASQYMAEDGSKVIDVFRVETSDPMNNMPASGTGQLMDTQSQMNLNTSGNKEIKIKTKTSDGKEIKTKIKNGKVKTKVDD